MDAFLSGVLYSSFFHSAGFIGFVSGNILYYNLFSNHKWVYKYATLIPTIGCIGGAYYLCSYKHVYSTISMGHFSYIAGAIIPHLFFMRNVNIIRQFDR